MSESKQTISNWKARGVSRDGAIKAERLYGVSVDWVLTGQGLGKTSRSDVPRDQLLSLDEHTVPPRTFSWEVLMGAQLPEQFRVALIDDAMAPDAMAGELVEMDTTEKPRPGDGVLVRDAAGTVYFRRFRPGRGDAWTAYASNPAYPSLESERDGLTIIATMLHVVRGRWG
jgi:phage repressor protein C with HTH and peptisase S24 domain